MSASTFFDRALGRAEQNSEQREDKRRDKRPTTRPTPRNERPRPDADDDDARDGWIGVDFARFTTAPRSRTWLPLLVLALAVALAIAALRIDLIRTRYALMDTMKQEQMLIEAHRALIVDKLRLRDPALLATLAEARGYRPAEVVRTLVDPMPVRTSPSQALPSVAAGPPSTHTPPAAENR